MKIRASSQYKDFGPENLFGPTSHGWLSDVGDVNGWIEMDFGTLASSLTVESGFHEYPDREDWGWHSRPKRIKLDDGTEHTLEDRMEPQTLILSFPRPRVRIEILEVYPGSKFNVVGLKRIVPQ